MNIGFNHIDEDAWLGSGTITGIHTYSNTLEIDDVPIARAEDTENTITFDEEGVVVAKNLTVGGQLITTNLIAPGFPPPGGDMALPDEANFKAINIVGGNLTLVPGSELFVADTSHLQNVSAQDIQTDTFITNENDSTQLRVNMIHELTPNHDITFTSKTSMTSVEANDINVNTLTVKNLTISDAVEVTNDVTSKTVHTLTVDTNDLTSATISASTINTTNLAVDNITKNITTKDVQINGNLNVDHIASHQVSVDNLEVDHIIKNITTKDVQMNGNLNVGNVVATSISTTDLAATNIIQNITTKSVHIDGDLTVSGSYPSSGGNSDIPSHIHTKHITLNNDGTFGHQKTEITYNKITLEDTNPSIFGSGGMGDITLDAATGSIKCNGGITCHNQYTSTANPAVIKCDSIDTLNVASDTITGHRSDFGRNTLGESIYASGQIECSHLKSTNIHNNGTCSGTWNFTGATVTGLPHSGGNNGYPSIQEYNDHVAINKRLAVSHVGWTNGNKVNFQGDIDFASATVTGLPQSGNNNPLPSIVENDTFIQCHKEFRASDVLINTVLKVNTISAESSIVNMEGEVQFAQEGYVSFEGDVDFTNATLHGLNPGTSYPSIIEQTDYLQIKKPIGPTQHTKLIFTTNDEDIPDNISTYVNGNESLVVNESDVVAYVPLRTRFVGFEQAGIEFEVAALNRLNFMLNDSLAFSIFENNDTTTRTIDYSTQTLLNNLLVNTISARPPNHSITFANNTEFEADTTFKGHVSLGNATLSGYKVAPNSVITFQNSPANTGDPTLITDMNVQTQYVGLTEADIHFGSVNEETFIIDNNILGKSILLISNLLVNVSVPMHTVSHTSSGNFTHCHLTEGDQSIDWQAGLCVTSTGEYCSRDTNGNIIAQPKDALSNSHGICKVRPSISGDIPLGIIASVEAVSDNQILHPHGGITIKAPVTESNGHKMVRVAASGDVLAWVLEPSFTEIDVPPLSGLWHKCVDNAGYNAGHTVLSNHVGFEADGFLMLDNRIIDTNTANVVVDVDTVKVYPPTQTELTPNLFSGVYNKTINGITQPIQMVMHCNNDYSFSFSEHFPSFEERVAALEATIAELTGPD